METDEEVLRSRLCRMHFSGREEVSVEKPGKGEFLEDYLPEGSLVWTESWRFGGDVRWNVIVVSPELEREEQWWDTWDKIPLFLLRPSRRCSLFGESI